MRVRGSPWPMKPPTAMLMPLLTCDIASSMETTLFFGTFHSFARERPGSTSGRAPDSECTLWSETITSRALVMQRRLVSGYEGRVSTRGRVGEVARSWRLRHVRHDASPALVCEPAALYTSGGAPSKGEIVASSAGLRPASASSAAPASTSCSRTPARSPSRRPSARPATRTSSARSAACAVAFLPRHARGHRILPGEVNYRANIWGMKALGVHYVLSRQRRRQPARGAQAARRGRARPALRPHQGAAEHVLRRRRRRPHGLRRPVLPAT